MVGSNNAPQVQVYRPSRAKTLAGKLGLPVFSFLNRPAFRRAAEIAYDFALRWNGFAIGFRGEHLNHAEERFLERYFARSRDGLLIDVGANIGSYTRFLRQLCPNASILAFEPHPQTFAKLTERAALPGVQLFNLALSDEAGTMTLHDFADNDGSTQASLGADAVSFFAGATVTHPVEVEKLDAFMSTQPEKKIAFLKIDTEGFDINVLRGAKTLLAAHAIDAIQFEFIPANVALRVTMRDFFEVLGDYRLHRLCVNGDLLPLGSYDVKRHEVYVIHNLVALAPGIDL